MEQEPKPQKPKNLDEEEDFHFIVGKTEEGILAIDSDIKTKYVNQKMAGVFGYSADAMIGAPLFQFMDVEGQQIAMTNISSRRPGAVQKHRFKFLHKNGGHIWVILVTNPLTDNEWRYIERWQQS